MNKNIIEIENLKFSYDKDSNISIEKLNIPDKKIISILGPSGSGKTTLLNLISGFLKNYQGQLKIKDDLSIKDMGYILQESVLYENISIFENISLSAKNSFKIRKKKRIEFIDAFLKENNIKTKSTLKIFEKYKINDKVKRESSILATLYFYLFFNKIKYFFKFSNQFKFKKIIKKDILDIANKLKISHLLSKKTSEISGGEKQRVAFAKAIIKQAELILMDEPFSSLDAKIKEETIEWMKSIKKQFNLSILIVTHDQNEAMKISDFIILMSKGKMEQFSDVNQLFSNPKNLFAAKFIGYPEINFLKEENGKFYYLRANKISIRQNGNSQDKIINIINLGDRKIYEIELSENKSIIKILDSSLDNWVINSLISISYDEKDLLIFDEKGERIYEK